MTLPTERTEGQSPEERRQAIELSLQRARPPAQVAGYEPLEFLGAGAYGEVWVAVDRNTGRRVAIKFYAHHGGLDWSLLTREVEKLRFLFNDRYVVQLIEVGWEAEPPFYVMEYVEHGSLAKRLAGAGRMAVSEAVYLFREVAIGLVHAHGKGVLHCDLKPANVLLDQDGRPRLADFGQARLSHEQTPSLGTLFYMAPEQADLQAAPDARWDVYALGALLFTMLVGQPPYKNAESVSALEQPSGLLHRLERYRELLRTAPAPSAHRQVRGVDRALADILDRCLKMDPKERFPNVQAVLDALQVREVRRSRQPLIILGALGPVLLMAVMGLFAWRGFEDAYSVADASLTKKALDSKSFAARFVAEKAAREFERRLELVEQTAASPEFRDPLMPVLSDPRLRTVCERLSDPDFGVPDEQLSTELRAERERLQQELYEAPARRQLQLYFENILREADAIGGIDVASWFVTDARGLQLARVPEPERDRLNIGLNFGWRTYFHGKPEDYDPSWRPGPDDHVQETHLSAVFQSTSSHLWVAAVSVPLFAKSNDEDAFIGVLAITVEIGEFADLEAAGATSNGNNEFAVLVDGRPGEYQGVILQHRLYDELVQQNRRSFLDRFQQYRVPLAELQDKDAAYQDPFGRDALGSEYNGKSLAAKVPVRVRGADTGLWVMVQERYDHAIGAALQPLKQTALSRSVIGLGAMVVIISGLWALVLRSWNQASNVVEAAAGIESATTPQPADTAIYTTAASKLGEG